MKRHKFFHAVVILLTCASLFVSSCRESYSYNSPVLVKQHNGKGPPDHAPAWGYRRKHGNQALAGSAPAIGGTIAKTSGKDNDHDDDDKTRLALIGVAAAAGTVYGVMNERDKKQMQAELDDIKQETNVVTIYVTNSNGSVSPVRLEKQGAGYVGPKGEYYSHLPTPEELKLAYGI